MNYDFYASKADKLKVLEFIFNETDLQIFDLSSSYGQEICQYKSIEEISTKFDMNNGNQFAMTFKMWSPSFKGEITFRKVDLNPKSCNGHTFRYATEGWGLINLYFGGQQNGILSNSNIGHFSQKGASKWEDINTANAGVDNWDWKEIEQVSRKLKNFINKNLAIRKIGTCGILEGADKLENEGVKLQ